MYTPPDEARDTATPSSPNMAASSSPNTLGGFAARTRRLSETDLHKTRALVRMEQCANCGSMVFAGSSECSVCGAWLGDMWQPPPKAARRAAVGGAVWSAVAIGVTALILAALLWHFLAR